MATFRREAVQMGAAAGPCPNCLLPPRPSIGPPACTRCRQPFSEQDREAMLERVDARRDRHFVLMFEVCGALVCAVGLFLAAWWLYR